MSKIKEYRLIVTLDYELFGDGSGSVLREQIIPTQHLMDISDLYGVKLTVFFEYGQYKAFEEANLPDYDSQNKLITEQLKELVRRGHDVQLHYHGQWFNSYYCIKEEKFILDLDLVDCSLIPYDDLHSVLKEGKDFLEKLLLTENPDYKCNCFRAGSWAASNDSNLVDVLVELGFKVDSSVLPGIRFNSELVNFDYTSAPQNIPYWGIDRHLNLESRKYRMFEVPTLLTRHRLAFFKYFNTKNRLSKRIFSMYYNSKISESNFSFIDKIKKIFGRDYYLADINTMSSSTLINMINRALVSEYSSFNNNKELIPIVLVGHPKVSYGIDDLHIVFDKLTSDENYSAIEFTTLSEFANEICKEIK